MKSPSIKKKSAGKKDFLQYSLMDMVLYPYYCLTASY